MTETAMEILNQYNPVMDTIEKETAEAQGYSILVCNITWNPNELHAPYHGKKHYQDEATTELPTQFTLELPDSVRNQALKKKNNFNDVIESFVYNFLTHKFNHEVYHCQIYLPF